MSIIKRYQVTRHPEFDACKVILEEDHDRLVAEQLERIVELEQLYVSAKEIAELSIIKHGLAADVAQLCAEVAELRASREDWIKSDDHKMSVGLEVQKELETRYSELETARRVREDLEAGLDFFQARANKHERSVEMLKSIVANYIRLDGQPWPEARIEQLDAEIAAIEKDGMK